MIDLVYAFDGRGHRWSARVRLDSDEDPAAYSVELTLWDAEVQALPGFDPDRRHLVAVRAIARAEGDALLERLRGIVVPLVPDAKLLGGYGGERHELRLLRGDCACILRWWLEVPAGWSDAAAVAATLRAWIVAWRAELLAAVCVDGPLGLPGAGPGETA